MPPIYLGNKYLKFYLTWFSQEAFLFLFNLDFNIMPLLDSGNKYFKILLKLLTVPTVLLISLKTLNLFIYSNFQTRFFRFIIYLSYFDILIWCINQESFYGKYNMSIAFTWKLGFLNGLQLAKMKKYIPYMSLP